MTTTPGAANACPTCGRSLGSAGGAHGCATVATVVNTNGKTVYQKWTDPTDSKDYCYLCARIHRNHAGVPQLCVWIQAETFYGRKLSVDADGYTDVAYLLKGGMIYSPTSKEGKAQAHARRTGGAVVVVGAPSGVCSVCHNGPLSPQEQISGICTGCQPKPQQAPAIAPNTRICSVCNASPAPVVQAGRYYCSAHTPPTPRRKGRVPLVPGAQRPTLTVGQAPQASPAPAAPAAQAGPETPAQRKARILAALKGK